MGRITLQGIGKVFGRDPARAMDLMAQGRTKAEIAASCGAVVGLRDVAVEELQAQGHAVHVSDLHAQGWKAQVDHSDFPELPPDARLVFRRRAPSTGTSAFGNVPASSFFRSSAAHAGRVNMSCTARFCTAGAYPG